jgi:hypothetical protein
VCRWLFLNFLPLTQLICPSIKPGQAVCPCRLSCPVSSIGKALDCESGNLSLIPTQCKWLLLWLIMKSFLLSFALYLCSGMYRSYQFLAQVKAISTGTILWLNFALVCSVWLTVVIWRVNYQWHHCQCSLTNWRTSSWYS